MMEKSDSRLSNFELLRIIAMLMIVMSHMSVQAFEFDHIISSGQFFLSIFCQGYRIAVNLFLMTGVWFMVDSRFSSKRILKLYGSLWFYSVPVTLLMLLLGVSVSKLDFLSCFFPFLRRRMWFVPLYISLLLFAPFLKRAIDAMTEDVHKKLVIVGFFLICIICTTTVFMDKYLDSLAWFIYIYFVIAYYKRYIWMKIRRKNVFLFAGVAIYFFLVVPAYLSAGQTPALFSYINRILSQYIVDYKSLPNFLCALCIFIFFSKLDIGSNKYINEISKNTLDVYMIHQSDTFYGFLWLTICRTHSWQGSDYFIPIFIGVTVLVYMGASVIGRIRVSLLEPLWYRSRLFQMLSDRLGEFYSNIDVD